MIGWLVMPNKGVICAQVMKKEFLQLPGIGYCEVWRNRQRFLHHEMNILIITSKGRNSLLLGSQIEK